MAAELDEQASTMPFPFDNERQASVSMFLHQCGARNLSDAELARLYELGVTLTEAEWQLLRVRAQEEGMEALVLTHAAEAGLLPVMPAENVEVLLTAYRNHWIWNRRLRGELRRIIAALRAHSIDVIVVKGIPLAERLYGEIACRPMADIDLLIRPQDAEVCGSILTTLGYAPLPGRATPSQWHALVNSALAFSHDDGFALDVHWALTSQPSYVASFPQAEIWQAANSAHLPGEPIKCLSLADELRFLCYHYAAQHQDKRLIWLVDIAQILCALPPDWDWEQFTADTIARGLATPVGVALNAAQTNFEVTLPPRLLLSLAEAGVRPRERAAWRAAHTSRNGFPHMYEHIKVQNGVRGRLTFGWQALLWHALLPARERFNALRRKLPAAEPG